VGHFVQLQATPSALDALHTGLTQFGPAAGSPEWLIGGVWLCTNSQSFLATAAVDVLADGQVARPLCLSTGPELVAQVEAELPDVAGRLRTRGSDIAFHATPALPQPERLSLWPQGPFSMSVVVRAYRRASHINHIACGLLFRSEAGRSLLIGTDLGSLALVFSENAELIERYRSDCDLLSLTDYFERCRD
jgi:hypothetical protein